MKDAEETILRIRLESHRSWENILNGIAALEGREDAFFGTPKVEQRSIGLVRQMLRETGLGLADLRSKVEKLAGRYRP